MLLCTGLEKTGNTVNAPARFTVETFAAGRANLEIIVLTAGGATIPVSSYLMSMDNKNALILSPICIYLALWFHLIVLRYCN